MKTTTGNWKNMLLIVSVLYTTLFSLNFLFFFLVHLTWLNHVRCPAVFMCN